jgi:hypothetical protein
MLKKLFNIITVLLLSITVANAQELNCKVKVLHEKITGVDKEVFVSMERSINEFLNARKWTTDQFNTTEKIDCNIMINLTTKLTGTEDGFEGTLNIQSSRPVYNSSYASPTINFVDRDIKFRFSQFAPLEFDDNRVSGNDPLIANLPATLAFYSYLILGLDYDSFSPNGGNDYFKKAQNVVNNAPEFSKVIYGWKAVDGNKNRYWLIDQMLSPRFAAFRSFWYTLHREALDNMYAKPAEARKAIFEGIAKLTQMNRENPNSILLQFFFNAKSDEIYNIVSQAPKDERAPYLAMLQQMDVPNAQKYNALR